MINHDEPLMMSPRKTGFISHVGFFAGKIIRNQMLGFSSHVADDAREYNTLANFREVT